ncbi:MAPEG family protein [Kangiella sp. HZ709]|uniref:MAPEG family protein n=1 Tax=Kangiella sp. HZ709 TaxID=2666328 RepID=UPI0012B08BBA|nr:MAPEG family protein [Kangiella sp. HZ709]MRX27029.1 hypothetical protein [Kangiella sp. HZ709]
MILVFTPIYAAILALFILLLAYQVVLMRRKKRIGIGDKGDQELAQKIRVHANAIEYVPIALLLIAFVEINGGSAIWVNISGALLVLSRVLHAYGLGKSIGISKGRFYGTLITWMVILSNALTILINSLANL